MMLFRSEMFVFPVSETSSCDISGRTAAMIGAISIYPAMGCWGCWDLSMLGSGKWFPQVS